MEVFLGNTSRHAPVLQCCWTSTKQLACSLIRLDAESLSPSVEASLQDCYEEVQGEDKKQCNANLHPEHAQPEGQLQE